MVTSHAAEVPGPASLKKLHAVRAFAREPVLPVTNTAEQLWDLHGTSLYALASGLLGNEPDAVRAVTLGMTDFLIQAESDPGFETSQVLRQLSRLVYHRCEAIAAEPSLSTTRTMPPLMVWLGELVQLQRACLALCVFGGHTHRETASLLGLPPLTVARMLTAGLHQLANRASGSGTTKP